MRLLIKGGRVIDPAHGLNAIMDVLLEEGRIVAVKNGLSDNDAEVIDARDKLVWDLLICMCISGNRGRNIRKISAQAPKRLLPGDLPPYAVCPTQSRLLIMLP